MHTRGHDILKNSSFTDAHWVTRLGLTKFKLCGIEDSFQSKLKDLDIAYYTFVGACGEQTQQKASAQLGEATAQPVGKDNA